MAAKTVFGPTATRVSARRGGEYGHRVDAEVEEEGQHLVLHHVGQRARDQKLARVGLRQGRDHRGEAGILALGEGRLDAGAGVVQHPHPRRMAGREPFGRAGEIELDDLGRAGADEEELPDVAPPGQKAVHLAFELDLRVGQTGQIRLFEDHRAEARLGKDHHACGALQKVGAGARADDEEEGVLHLSMEPDDAGKAAEYLVLAALLQHRRRAAADGGRRMAGHAAASSRAARSFKRNWPALMTYAA